MDNIKIGIIGGTGLYSIEGIEEIDRIEIETPFGQPSDSIRILSISERKVAFLPRHGEGHTTLPSELPVQANIWAFKKLGVERLISVSAVGSLKEELKPRDIVIPSQIIDRTKSRPSTYFGNGIVGHISFADPFCPQLSGLLYETIKKEGFRVHTNETYICMEGPQFSTRAESNLYRMWGGGVIGMTAIPEAKLAREAEICYVLMSMVTDYDCWKEGEEEVSVEMIIENLNANREAAGKVLKSFIKEIPEKRECGCGEAAKYAIITSPDKISAETKEKLGLFYSKYWKS
ncbi:MAG: S-methyl-5'-thioadenosine phosphorylase [Spirochaetes bacterium]|nr:MAG: S-methyl-5'-thioadenosine phosphorylase [Spirochaetota bacterium]